MQTTLQGTIRIWFWADDLISRNTYYDRGMLSRIINTFEALLKFRVSMFA